MNINQIRETRAAKVAEMRALLAKPEAEKRNLTAAEQTAFDGLKSEVVTLEADEQRAAFMAEAERRMMGEPIGDPQSARLEARVSILRVLQAGIEGRALTGAEAEYATETERRTGRKAQGVFVPASLLETRINNTTSAPELIGTDHRADQYIEPFRNALLARRLGVRVLSGLRGNLSVPKHGTGTTVGWVAEGSAVPDSTMGFDAVTMTPKHAGGVTEMSRQLIMQSSPDIETLLRDDLAFMLAQAIDSALIKGGGSNEPTGILASIGSNGGVQSGALATLTWANVLAMLELIETANAGATSWLTSPDAAGKLRGTLKATGIAGYLAEGGRMADLPLFVTNQVPLASTKGQIILGDWSQVMLGIWSEIDILVNPFAETPYKRGGVLVRAMSTVDIALRHPEAFVVADDIAL